MLRAVIAGCGYIAVKKHIPAFLKFGDKIKIVAICDLNSDVAQKVGKEFKINRVYSDFSEMLLREKPDIVDICTPPKTHPKLAIEAIEKGAHVFLEKPMALGLADCDAMIDAALRHKREICVMHNQIFNPAFMQARKEVKRGAIGDFLGLKIFLSTPVDYMTSDKNHWAHSLPGGLAGETGPHAVYLALAFLKRVYDVRVSAKKILPEYPWSDFEDYRINLIAENGMASIALVYASNQWAAEMEIIGTKGTLRIDLEARSVIRYSRPALNPFLVGLSELGILSQTLGTLISNGLNYILGKRRDTHLIGIAQFVKSILENKPLAVGTFTGRETVSVMQMIADKLNNFKERCIS